MWLLSLESVTIRMHNHTVSISKTCGHGALWVNIHYVFGVLRWHHRSRTWLLHAFEQTSRSFTRFRAVNLKLHVKKCNLFHRRVEFLGHMISEKGIDIQGEKVQAVREWPTPRNVTELRSFLGLCSYYRRFVDRFAGNKLHLSNLRLRLF